MARMLQHASKVWWTGCGCSQCDKGGRLKRKARRNQRAREASAVRREVSQHLGRVA